MNSNKFYTKKSLVNGVGLYVKQAYKPDDFIEYVRGPIHCIRDFTPEVLEQMENWIGASKHTWINTDESPFRFINHSCDPNVAISTKRRVIAIKHIQPDTEIRMDYSFTEPHPEWEISPCTCGAKNCRGRITGIPQIPSRTFKNHQAHISNNFKKIYLAYH